MGMLVPSIPPPPKPPDPDPILDPDPPLDGEGETEEKGVNPEEDPSPEAMNELQDFRISVGSDSCSCCTSCTYCYPVDEWVDFDTHAAMCHLAS
jgi:hypothetical protein